MSQQTLTSEDFDEYAEKDRIFRETMTEDEEEDTEPSLWDTAIVYEISFRKTTTQSGILSLIFQVSENEFRITHLEVFKHKEHNIIEALDVTDLTNLISRKFEFEDESVYLCGTQRQVSNCIIERFASESNYERMNKKFHEVYYSDESQFQTATIVDYDIEKAGAAFAQDLKITLYFDLENDMSRCFSALHGPEHPSTVLTHIFEEVGIENPEEEGLFHLKGETVNIVYTETDDKWKLHFGRRPTKLHKLLPFLSHPTISSYAEFGVTYGHKKNAEDAIKKP